MNIKIKTFASYANVEDLDKQINDWLASNDVEFVNAVPFAMQQPVTGTYHYQAVYMTTIVYRER